jgi:hypothetical protein
MCETTAPALREQWAEQAAAIGMTVEEIVEEGKGRHENMLRHSIAPQLGIHAQPRADAPLGFHVLP